MQISTDTLSKQTNELHHEKNILFSKIFDRKIPIVAETKFNRFLRFENLSGETKSG